MGLKVSEIQGRSITDFLVDAGGYSRLEHPFLCSNGMQPEDAPNASRVILNRLAAYQTAVQAENWRLAVNVIEPLFRLPTLIEYASDGRLSPAEAWDVARKTWLALDTVYPIKHRWIEFFGLDLGCSHRFMSDAELTHLFALPERIRIYRGYRAEDGRAGLSWTMSKVVASAYSLKYGCRLLGHAEVGRDQIAGYINARGHHEIVLLDEDVVINHRAVNALTPAKMAAMAARRRIRHPQVTAAEPAH